MATFSIRKRFSPREVGAIRKKFYAITDRAEIKFEMCVDGSPVKGDAGHETFFRFSTEAYYIELIPCKVRHKKAEPAVNVIISSFGNNNIFIDYQIATSVKKPAEVLEEAFTVIEGLERLHSFQALS